MRPAIASLRLAGFALLIALLAIEGCTPAAMDSGPGTAPKAAVPADAKPAAAALAPEVQQLPPPAQAANQLARLCWAGALDAVRDDSRGAAEIERLRQERYRQCIAAGQDYIMGR